MSTKIMHGQSGPASIIEDYSPRRWKTREERRKLLSIRVAGIRSEFIESNAPLFLVCSHLNEAGAPVLGYVYTVFGGANEGELVTPAHLQNEGKDGILENLLKTGKIRKAGRLSGRAVSLDHLDADYLDELDDKLLAAHPELRAPGEISPASDAESLSALSRCVQIFDGLKVFRVLKPYAPGYSRGTLGVVAPGGIIAEENTARNPEERPERLKGLLDSGIIEPAGVVRRIPTGGWTIEPGDKKKK
jgi:hypothetical protein